MNIIKRTREETVKRREEIIRDRIEAKMTYQAIAQKYGISRQRVYQIVNWYMQKTSGVR